MGIIGSRDKAVIAGELGRTPRDLTGIAARCPFGYPAVIETAPILTTGEPNPTLLYVTCPSLANAISRVEAGGGIRLFKASCRDDERLRALLRDVTRLYQERRTALAGRTTAMLPLGPRLGAGIGGPEGPEIASCLHAYAAALLAVMTGWLSTGPAGQTQDANSDPGDAGNGGEGRDPDLAAAAREVWERFLPAVETAWCVDTRCARWDTGQKPAAIDVGTISVRLLVAELANRRPRTVVRRAEVTRLGEGLQPGAPLSEEAKRRTAEVVARYAEEARARGADSILLAATSAAREASDGEDFIRFLGRENGITAVVLPGTTEAQLAFAGASLDIQGNPVVIDVGGGSTELMRRLDNGVVRAVSLDVGASRATERWIRSDPPTAREIANIRQEAKWAFSRVGFRFSASGEDVSDAENGPMRRLVGVAGTVTTLAALDAGLAKYDSEYLHLRTLTLDRVRALVERLSGLTLQERTALPCMQAGRAAVIVGGAAVLLTAMETLGYDQLTVSERDLLDGLVLHGAPDEPLTGSVLT